METKIEVKEQDLFKIKTIKKKHAEQIDDREHYQYEKPFSFEGLELLGYIDGWSAVLVRDANGHYRIKHISAYADWLVRTTNVDHSEAYRQAKQLQQLFLD